MSKYFEEFSNSSNKFRVFDYSKPGKNFSELMPLPPPIFELEKDDFLILNIFGNDWLEKHISIDKNPKLIHLTKIRERPLSYFLPLFKILKKQIVQLNCKVIIIDNILRHIVRCCQEHDAVPRSFAKQAKLNKFIFEYFSKVPNCVVVPHLKFLGKRHKWINNMYNYSTILADQVHLLPQYYKKLVEQIVHRIIFERK
jgi:hypothetical protein